MTDMTTVFMHRAIQLAKLGMRAAYPNPSVGAVIVYQNKIIGEGYTAAYGGHHAEVNAVNSVEDKSLLSKSTLYVTLEPCAHYGKTPPCANLITSHKIPKIYIGCVDTNTQVSGKGIEILLLAGCEVHVGVLEEECLDLHKRFLTYQNKQRPYVILKWAETQDGFVDVDREVSSKEEAKPNWITGALSKNIVHQLRASEHAIMVGTNTAIKDNPSLTTREAGGENPKRVVIDNVLKIPEDYHLLDDKETTFVFTAVEKEAVLNTKYFTIDFNENVIAQIIEILYEQKIQSIIIEGGALLLQSFIDEGIWDEAWQFVGEPKFESGILAPKFTGDLVSTTILGADQLKIYKNQG